MATTAAESNMLFGLLALQNGLIEQDQLVAAFRGWTRDQSRPLAEYLASRGDLDPDQRAGVEAMVGLHLKKHGGSTAKSLAASQVGRSTRESLIALGDPAIEQTLTLLTSGSEGDADHTASYAVGTSTAEGQRFRVLRPHARGGLGAVFVALDAELNREVALKQILDQHADDPTSRTRFVLEAEITGGLEHPGIVPIYGLGTYTDGRPFYAMRFIKGDSLKEAADRFHADEAIQSDLGRRALELRKLLRRFTDVCNAIGYAHSRGVLHRDIKPGNIIIGRYGETLVVDWGLAKATGRTHPGQESGERTLIPSSASGSAETLPGSAMGTPAYMSPEQAEGDIEHLGPQSDIYSLGATLYYLLAGRAPVEGDIGAVLRAVQRGEFSPPRWHDATIDPALEASCLKAMAHQPGDRYSSPKALAEDIERWMADEPVSAWREPISRRVRRWANRNRTAVASVAVALTAGVVGLSVVLAVQTRAKAEVTRALAGERSANLSLAAANDELARSQAAVRARYDLAIDAIKTFHTGVSEDFLLKQDQFKELRDRLLKAAGEFYGKLGALLGKETDTASRRALGHANYALANLTERVGQTQEAIDAFRRVVTYFEALAAEPGANVDSKVDVGQSLASLAWMLKGTGRVADSEQYLRQAERLLASLNEPGTEMPEPESLKVRAALAQCRGRLGWLLHDTGRKDQALQMFLDAKTEHEAVASADGATASARVSLAGAIGAYATVLSETGKTAAALVELNAAITIQKKVVDDDPEATDYRRELAATYSRRGLALWQSGKQSEALVDYRAAKSIFKSLADKHPAVADFQNYRASMAYNIGTVVEH